MNKEQAKTMLQSVLDQLKLNKQERQALEQALETLAAPHIVDAAPAPVLAS